MPVLVPVGKAGKSTLIPFNGATPTGPRALQNTFFFDTRGRGIPRRENLLGIRILETTHAVQIPMNTIKAQVATTPWMVRTPEGVTETAAHVAAAKEIEWFLDGNFNPNGESFSHLLKKWIGDILAVDAGVLELVADENGFLAEIYCRDGLTFTKAPDTHGRLPAPGSKEAAYWQFSLAGLTGTLERNDALLELVRENLPPNSLLRPFAPIAFARDQLVWTEENPRSYDEYGLGRLQICRRLIEIILNQDVTNRKWFLANEIPEGLLQFVEANETEIQRFRAYWEQNIKGKQHKLPIVGGKEAQWLMFHPKPADLQFLESQAWYHKLVWFVFGLSPNEVGEVVDINKANGEEQAVAVWRKTTKPLLELLGQELNRKVLPFMEAYGSVGGELEFSFDFDNPTIRAIRRGQDKEDLDLGLVTLNEVRKDRGQEPVPWGDAPLMLIQSLVTRQPEWCLQEWLDYEADEVPIAGGIFLDAQPGDGAAALPDDLAEWTPAIIKEALRDDDGWHYPAVAGIANTLSAEVAKVFAGLQADLVRSVERRFTKSHAFDVAAIVAEVDITQALRRAVVAAGLEALQVGADYHARRMEKELRDRLGRDAPELRFDVSLEDTFAAKSLAQRAARRMTGVNETVKRLVRDTLIQAVNADGGNVTTATAALKTLFQDRLTDGHARLVARTEILAASRSGSQAFSEGTDLIAGKGWRATHDERTRAWHRAMDGVVVAKGENFTVPVVDKRQAARGYPKSVFVVGEDEPFNCRCDQYPVLRADLPGDAKGFASMLATTRHGLNAVTVKAFQALTTA